MQEDLSEISENESPPDMFCEKCEDILDDNAPRDCEFGSYDLGFCHNCHFVDNTCPMCEETVHKDTEDFDRTDDDIYHIDCFIEWKAAWRARALR